MASIREVLADNLKAYRRKNGLSQDKLAERAAISPQYLATVETCRKFPTPEVLDRLARALDIEPYALFGVTPSPEKILEGLQQAVAADITQAVRSAVKEALAAEYDRARSKRNACFTAEAAAKLG